MENYVDEFELDEMKQQIQLLRDKLAKEIIVSEKLLKNSTQDKVAYINRKKRFIYFLIGFALVYCNTFFLLMGYSWIFCVFTSVFLIIAGIYQRYSHKGVSIDCISTGNLLDISRALVRMNQLGLRWLYFGIPFALCWIVWFMFESYPKVGGEMICYGGSVGFVLGAVGGILHCVQVRRKAKEAIRGIEEYTIDN
ncbi:hypothetical protein [uncultured Bacteroides sp.]|uniref:hypothetical protein n=1 Tax=uncultured Bacteroides sp. TaxID=162156 RepID=UPI00280A5C1F|nr:hypothetical protein [uncultured Bacteroides sp.]